jgi:magnesium transporter
MLKYYVRRSSSEEFQSVTTPPADNVWIHGEAVSYDELHSLSHMYGMDINVLRDVLDIHELPRVEVHPTDGLYVFVRMVQRGKHGKIVTTPVLMVVKDSVFVNVSTALTSDPKLAKPGIVAQSKDTVSLLLSSFAAVIGEYEELMQRTARYVHDTGQRLRSHEVTNNDFIKFVTIEDNLNEYLMNLNSMMVVAERLREILRDSQDTEAVEDILLYIRQLIVSIQSHNQSITSIRNAYGTIANNVLNQRMKTLTALTLLIALPNVFYGMYGMNIGLPYQEHPLAYPIIIISSLVVVFLVFIMGRKRGIF